ncbi:TPA: hypothetical protein RNS88_002246 [Stenotrophomonas maltophilia]|uniref:Uncharacterized protein n=1 Tax=Stenotrophomonas maltophilia TaxID=40324 RepID=A0AAI9CFA6_STEMA|nr:hypothetical protein [Stenotrophomonas maltophilia]HDX0922356.1 hypothetical protein [Stenotrophomonas maltophilia]
MSIADTKPCEEGGDKKRRNATKDCSGKNTRQPVHYTPSNAIQHAPQKATITKYPMTLLPKKKGASVSAHPRE